MKKWGPDKMSGNSGGLLVYNLLPLPLLHEDLRINILKTITLRVTVLCETCLRFGKEHRRIVYENRMQSAEG
jgi:hypothetical protein